ncbi:FAD:protein FMN transferase [bacterium]|nr:FAD:protein FMN transferase [bacterium]
MDTVVRISFYDPRPQESLERLADEVFVRMLAIENAVSSHMPGSDVERLDEHAGGQPTAVSSWTESILRGALEVSETSRGAFDVTTGPIKSFWGFDDGNMHLPDTAALNAYLALGDTRNVHVDSGYAWIDRAGLKVDLGGIAKGFIIDSAVMWLMEQGVKTGLVEGGGDMRLFGPHPKRGFWRIGIQHPRSNRGTLIGVVTLKDRSIATSGDYERYFIHDGVRYHHILDPKTGFPVKQVMSVTVLAPSALMADAYATAVFVLGPVEGLQLLNRLPDIEGLIVYQDATGPTSSGLNHSGLKDSDLNPSDMVFAMSDHASEWIRIYPKND